MIATIRFSILVIDVEIVQSVQLTAYNLEMFGVFSQKKLLKAQNILMATKLHIFKQWFLHLLEKSFFFLNFLLIDWSECWKGFLLTQPFRISNGPSHCLIPHCVFFSES